MKALPHLLESKQIEIKDYLYRNEEFIRKVILE